MKKENRIKNQTEEQRDYGGAIDQGLEGVISCTTSISTIKEGQLFYRGYSIEDLAWNSNFEEVIFLLWKAYLPTSAELEEFKKELNSYITLEDELIEALNKFPTKNVHPMAWLRTAVSFLALHQDLNIIRSKKSFLSGEEKENSEVDAFLLTARMGQLVALFERIRRGEQYISPLLDKSLSWNFHYCLNGSEPDQDIVDVFDKCLILHADHELNCSTFSARVTSSSLSDVYSAVVSGIGTLKGPLHGGANEQVMKTLRRIGKLENVTPWLKKELSLKKKIMGFGHRVYKNGDPRAQVLKKLSESLSKKALQEKWYEISKKLEKEVREAKRLLPNVDFYSATVYNSMGIPHDLFTPIFSVARISGWLAHLFEQRRKNRIYRPRAKWIGESSCLKWMPLERRNSVELSESKTELKKSAT